MHSLMMGQDIYTKFNDDVMSSGPDYYVISCHIMPCHATNYHCYVMSLGSLETEEVGEEEDEYDDDDDDDDEHYGVTIGHVLQDDTVQAVLASGDDQLVVSIPAKFRRVNSRLAFLSDQGIPNQLSEVGCLLIPPETPITCAITGIDCGGLCGLLGR